jgi:hypothetical protein
VPSSDFTTPLVGTVQPQGTVTTAEAARLIAAEKARRAKAAREAEDAAQGGWLRKAALGASVVSSLLVGAAAIKYIKKLK